MGGRFKWRKGLLVGETRRASDNGFCKAHGMDFPLAADFRENRKGQMILVRAQAAKSVAEGFGKHRNNAVRKIDAVSARDRFAVQPAFRGHIMRHVGDVNAHAPSVMYGLHLNRVVEVASIVGIDREDEAAAQILAAFEFLARRFQKEGLPPHEAPPEETDRAAGIS